MSEVCSFCFMPVLFCIVNMYWEYHHRITILPVCIMPSANVIFTTSGELGREEEYHR